MTITVCIAGQDTLLSGLPYRCPSTPSAVSSLIAVLAIMLRNCKGAPGKTSVTLMAGLVAMTVLAVSVSVAAPRPEMARRMWFATPESDFGHLVANWATSVGVKYVDVPREIAELPVGSIEVRARTVCGAVRKLVSAMKYSERPARLLECDANHISIVPKND